MRPSDKIIIIQREDRVGGVEEFGMKDDFHPIGGVVEQLHTANLVQNRVVGIVDHIVGDHRGEGVAFHAEQPPTKHDSILAAEQLLGLGSFVPFVPLQRSFKQPLTHFPFDHADGVAQRFDHRLPFQRFYRQRMRLGGHDYERDDRHLRTRHLEAMVQSREGFDEHIHPFVSIFVSPRREEIEGVLGLKVDVTVKMASDEIVYFLLRLLVEILELVHSRKFLHIQSVWHNAIRLPLQEVLAFIGRDVRDRGEDVCRVRGSPLDAVSMINPPFAGLGVHIKVLQVVVEIDISGTKIPPEQRGMGGEDGGDVNFALFRQRQRHSCKPLMKLGNDGFVFLVRDIL